MQNPNAKHPVPSEIAGLERTNGEQASDGTAGVPQRRERHTVRLVLGLTGLLGVAWAVAIVSRYPNLLPG